MLSQVVQYQERENIFEYYSEYKMRGSEIDMMQMFQKSFI